MSQKRQPEEGKEGGGSDGNSPGEKRQKVPALRGVVMEAMKMNAFQKLLSALEPLLRRVVKEEVELALTKHLANMRRHCGKQVHPSVSRNLQLQFMSKLSLPIFTGTKVEGEECCGLSIALVDALTRQVVISGPESSMKVEIVVLEGDFEGDEENNWTFEDFKSNIVKEREGKRSLLAGDVFLDLTEGMGVVGELAFTDNSSWTRSRKFRLGARVEDGNFNGMRVREAKTEAFMVKDHRGELYKKHYPPSLLDEVWRLEKIGKDGAFHKRLSSENIHTVKDFLTLLCIDASRLRNILGTGMSAKMWEVTVEHARTCTINGQPFIYYPNAQQKMGVVFNIVGEVLGILSDRQYTSVNDLSETQKADAHKFVKLAFEHWVDVIPCDIGAVMGGGSNSSYAVPASCPNSSYAVPASCPSGSQQITENLYSEMSNSHKADGLSFINSSIASPDIMSSIFSMGGGCTRSLDTSVMQSIDNLESRFDSDFLSCDIRELCKFPNSLMFDAESSTQTFFGEENLQYFDTETSLLSPSLGADSPSDLGTAVAAFLATRPPAGRGKVNTRWRTLISVLRWRFSIKRIVALKRKTLKKVIYGNVV